MFRLKFIVFIATVFSLHMTEAKPLDDIWQLARQTSDVWIWTIKGNSHITGTLRSQAKVKPTDWQKIKSPEFFKDLTKKKRRILSLIGIIQWEANTYNWKKKKDHHELVIKGSYLNGSGQKVQFTEHHLFFKYATHQILVTAPLKSKIKRDVTNRFIASVTDMVKRK